MKRRIITLIAMCSMVAMSASAQVSKQVEVTKDYAPEVDKAQKMEVTPVMVNMDNLTPEIEYTNSLLNVPNVLDSETRHFDPAKVTYWEYQRRYPFYLKLGAGLPLNTIGDLYASSYRAGVGYIAGYANHYGLYSKLRYTNGLDKTSYKDNRSMQMNNRFGVMGGKYFGRYTLAGDLSYDMDIYHRYPFHNQYNEAGEPVLVYKNRRIDFGDVKLGVSFGDSFVDFSHLNFKAHASIDYFHDKSENFVATDHYQQMNVTAGVALAREITKSSILSLDVDYEGYYGLRSLKGANNSLAGASLLYRFRADRMVDFNVGAKLVYDHNPSSSKTNRWYVFPLVNVSFNVSKKGLVTPYVEIDGSVQNNSYYSLVKRNPYVSILGEGNSHLQGGNAAPNTQIYNVRLGASGNVAKGKLSYRGYFDMTFMKDALYWYNINQIFFDIESARRNIWTLCGAVDYRPLSSLLITAQVKGLLYTNYASVANALPNVEALVKLRYTHNQFTVGGSLELYGPTKCTWVQKDNLFNADATTPVRVGEFRAPTSFNLSVYVDWRVSKTCTIFLEGNNLLGDILPTYRWAFYRELGASFLVGVKVKF